MGCLLVIDPFTEVSPGVGSGEPLCFDTVVEEWEPVRRRLFGGGCSGLHTISMTSGPPREEAYSSEGHLFCLANS